MERRVVTEKEYVREQAVNTFNVLRFPLGNWRSVSFVYVLRLSALPVLAL